MAMALLALPFMIRAQRRAREAQVRRWRSVAERLGLRELESATPFAGNPRLTGRAERRRVQFERYTQGKYLSFTQVTVEGNSGITLRREGSTIATNGRGEREIELGDDDFDAEVEVHGAPERVRALLDAETRVIVRRMLGGLLELPGRPPVTIRGTVVLADGELRALFAEQPTPPTPRELSEGLGALLALAERFQRPANVAQRLASSIEHEPQWPVRLRGLELLSTSYPNDPATVAASRHALADELAEVRLQAAIALGEEGQGMLLEIASGERVEDATAAHAIDVLGDRFPADLGMSLLQQALRLRRLHTADACIHVLGRVGGTAASPLLAKVLSREIGPLAVAAAQALGKSGGPEAEEALLDALGRGAPDLRIPVIEALGHTGSVRAVLPIKNAAEGPDSDADVRRAARQAVAEIQSRLPGATPGQVSIAEGEAGQLSIADDDPRGRVSLPEGR